MRHVFLPFLAYYGLFGLLLPFWQWVIGTGIILMIIVKMRFDTISTRFSALPALVRRLSLAVALLGIFGTMPTSFLYGAMAAEVGGNFGRLVDDFFRLPSPVLGVLIGMTAGIISATALIAWALIIWGTIGAVIGFCLNLAYQFLRRKFRDASAS